MNALALHGVIVPLVTPFTPAGAVDLASFDALARSVMAAGVHGLVLNGTTGESPTMRREEVDVLTRRLVSLSDGKIPVLVGTGTYDTADSVSRTERARVAGASGALVVVPYYSRPAPAGVIAHFRAVAEVGLLVVAYNIPYRTGLVLDRATLASIVDIPGVVGIKESSGGLANSVALVERGSATAVLCGEDLLFFASLCHGAPGGILASSNLLAPELVSIHRAVAEGDLSRARTELAWIAPIIELLYAEPNPSPLKWALWRRGTIAAPTVRLPLAPISEDLANRLTAALEERLTPAAVPR